MYISVNNNTNINLFKILSNYIIWDRLSQKTISRYCPFKAPTLLGIKKLFADTEQLFSSLFKKCTDIAHNFSGGLFKR